MQIFKINLHKTNLFLNNIKKFSFIMFWNPDMNQEPKNPFPNQPQSNNPDARPEPKISYPNGKSSSDYDFDIFVIGGGSGGCALARQAGAGGASVALADQVKPSTQGTKWGVGGTCVNVGCIPKKLMHTSSLFGELRSDMRQAGWDLGDKDLNEEGAESHEIKARAFNWNKMVENVQRHIKGLNLDIKKTLMNSGVMYQNGLVKVLGPNTVEVSMDNGKVLTKNVRHIVVAVGGRPNMDAFPGCAEHCLSSDDIFSQTADPGKTLIVGASQIALECGGFLSGMGQHVDIMVRSILLRGFDQECADKIGEFMEKNGCNFIRKTVPSRVEKLENGQKRVFYTKPGTEEEIFADYDTVMVAIGRHADVSNLGLDSVGASLSKNNKLVVDQYCKLQGEQTDSIQAIGDVCEGKLELTPTAVLDGKMLAGRLLSQHQKLMDWANIPTTVFTPLEYTTIGLSEEEADAKQGKDNQDIYAKPFRPLEWEFLGRPKDLECQVKLLVEKNGKVVGLHQLGPNAGEVGQGWAIAFKLGATKEHFDMTIGIHPTTSEMFTTMDTVGKGEAGPC